MNSMVICLIIFAVMIILFFNRKIPMAFTSMGVIVALYVAGCVDKATVFAGFGNNNVLTMAGMFIVAAGLSRTQMVNNITKLLYRVNNGSFTRVLASYILVIFLLGQFVPSLPAMFAMVYPLVISMCKQLKCSPSKMMYPIAVTVVSTSFVIEPIGPYAAWFVTQNGYLESYGWTGSLLSMWSETMVFLPTALVTLLLTIFVLPKLMPDQPETETVAITGPDITNNEALSPVREFLGYGIFIATVIGLMLGLPSWAVTMAGAFLAVAFLEDRRTAGHAPFKACAENISLQHRLCRQNGIAEILAEQRIGNALHTDARLAVIQRKAVAAFIIGAQPFNQGVGTLPMLRRKSGQHPHHRPLLYALPPPQGGCCCGCTRRWTG